jgi:molecular chaperone DnaK
LLFISFSARRQALQRLTEAAEKAKIELSALTQTSINLPFITATAEGPKHIDVSLSKAQFEQLCSDLLDRVRRPVEQSLRDAKLSISDINEVRAERWIVAACVNVV